MGVAYINRPTAAENKETAAKSAGFGLQINNFNNYFYFDKDVTAKLNTQKQSLLIKLKFFQMLD